MHEAIHKLAHTIARYLALLGFTGLLVLSILVVADILLRTLIGYPLKGVNDISAMVMALVISACIPQSLFIKQSISVEVLGDVLGGRGKLVLDMIASLAVLVFFSLMAWQLLPYAASITASGERTWVLRWPVGPWWYAAAACFVFSAVVQLLVVIDDVLSVLYGRPWTASYTSPDGSL